MSYLVDVQILLYAHGPDAPQQREAAQRWIDRVMARREEFGLPWSTLHGFLRIATNPGVFQHPLTMELARDIVDSYLSRSNVFVPSPTPGYWDTFRRLLLGAQSNHSLVMDTHLAALALEYNATICTNDRDFSRFPGIKVVYPLQSGKN